MANQTDHPAAVAAREAFEIAASQEPRKGLSIQLPESFGVALSSNGATNNLPNIGAVTGREI